MANGVKFGAWHSSTDFDLFLNSKDIGVPNPKTSYVSIPFGDGSADLTNASGEVKFENRILKFKFTKIGGDFVSVFSNIQNKLHGQKMQIVLDTDPNYYYNGRVSVEGWNSNATTGDITIEAVCDPYKYILLPTTQIEAITTSKSVTITNNRKTAYPKITTTAAFSIVKDGITYSYGVVASKQSTIPLLEGENTLVCTGTGTITFEWQEGAM